MRLIAANALALTFVVIKVLGDATLIQSGVTPATSVFWACWFTLTGVHAAHVLGGALFTGWMAGPAYRISEFEEQRWAARIDATRRYWLFIDVVWLVIVVSFHLI